MKRLWVQVTLALMTVAGTTLLLSVWLVNTQVDTQFRQFVVRNDILSTSLLNDLRAYYAQTGSWQGANALLPTQLGQRMMMGRGMGTQGHQEMMSQPIHGGATLRLADATGQVLYRNNEAVTTEQYLSRAELAQAVPLETVSGEVIGYLAVQTSNETQLTETATAFLSQVNRALLQAGLLAGAVGLVMSIFIARGIAAPVNTLTAAAQKIAKGDLSQQVPVRGPEEVARLAYNFNNMASDLLRAETLRRNLVADIAHELRTPLTVIQGNLQAILEGVYPLERGEIEDIYQETVLLTHLVQDLRDLAQAEAGQLSFDIQRLDSAPLITSLSERFRELAREKNITLQTDLPPNLPPLLADEQRTLQVLHNLISNALRHTPPGGQIRLALQTDPLTPAHLRFSVSDTGPGLSEEEQAHVFDRFWRADKARVRDQGGSGLGLSIARQLVENQQGRIGVQSQPGAGSTFWFSLPCEG